MIEDRISDSRNHKNSLKQ